MAVPNPPQTIPHLPKPPDPTPMTIPSSSKAAGSRSFAAAVAQRPKTATRLPDLQLANRQYGSKDGVPAITFSTSEYQAITQRLSYTIVAKFQIGRPSLKTFEKFIVANWFIKGRFSISSNWDDRHVVIVLDTEEDVTAALTCPFRRVGHCGFRLFRWTPDYNPKKESTLITKWLRLPDLPMEFANRACLKAILSSFCGFLDVDDRTKAMTSLQCARACVELDIAKPIPSKVWISFGDSGFFQDIVVEGSILYCLRCKLHGHDINTCKKAARANARASKLVPADHVTKSASGGQGTKSAFGEQVTKSATSEQVTKSAFGEQVTKSALIEKVTKSCGDQIISNDGWTEVQRKKGKARMQPQRGSLNTGLNTDHDGSREGESQFVQRKPTRSIKVTSSNLIQMQNMLDGENCVLDVVIPGLGSSSQQGKALNTSMDEVMATKPISVVPTPNKMTSSPMAFSNQAEASIVRVDDNIVVTGFIEKDAYTGSVDKKNIMSSIEFKSRMDELKARLEKQSGKPIMENVQGERIGIGDQHINLSMPLKSILKRVNSASAIDIASPSNIVLSDERNVVSSSNDETSNEVVRDGSDSSLPNV